MRHSSIDLHKQLLLVSMSLPCYSNRELYLSVSYSPLRSHFMHSSARELYFFRIFHKHLSQRLKRWMVSLAAKQRRNPASCSAQSVWHWRVGCVPLSSASIRVVCTRTSIPTEQLCTTCYAAWVQEEQTANTKLKLSNTQCRPLIT